MTDHEHHDHDHNHDHDHHDHEHDHEHTHTHEHDHEGESLPVASKSLVVTYQPLLLVLTAIVFATVLTAWFRVDFALAELMRLFMGYFFVVFAAFKFMDLRAFAHAYAEYDIVAARSRAYAFAYPFIEGLLGIAYLAAWQLTLTSAVTLVVMLVSSVGVLKALRGPAKIRCACLGAVIKLPMTTVTLIEDVGMAVMAAVMLFL